MKTGLTYFKASILPMSVESSLTKLLGLVDYEISTKVNYKPFIQQEVK